MKRLLTLVFIVTLAANLVYAQDGWVTQRADKVSVKFPGTPKEFSKNNFKLTDKYNAVYSISVEDLVTLGIDSARLAEDKTTPEFLSFMKERISNNLHDGKIDDFKVDNWKGFTSYSSVITGISKKAKMYIFMVLIGNKMYTLLAIIPDGVATLIRDDFFSSLSLTN